MSLVDESELYNDIAQVYDAAETLPLSGLYQQLVEHALGPSCIGKTVLDLGGGVGLHARKAVDRGAEFVDNVDISEGMLKQGQFIDRHLGRSEGRIRWYVGDVTQPLKINATTLPLQPDGYDIVMMNWVFDHAENMDELEAMWANTAAFCKPDGLLISIRVANLWAENGGGRYGVTITNHERIPGGCRYVYNSHSDPPFSASATTMEASWDFEQSKALAAKYGFVEFSTVPAKEMDVVKNDLEFWQSYLNDPFFVCITARKAAY